MIITQKMLTLARKKWTLYNGNNPEQFRREFLGLFPSLAAWEERQGELTGQYYFFDVSGKIAICKVEPTAHDDDLDGSGHGRTK